MLGKPRKSKDIEDFIRESWNDRRLGQIFYGSLSAHSGSVTVANCVKAETHLEFKPIKIPQSFYEQPVLLRQMTPARKLGSRIAGGTAIFQDIVDQRLLVLYVHGGGKYMSDKSPEVCIGSGRVKLRD